MSKLPSLNGKKLISLLQKLGFEVIRIKGSHHFLKHKDGRATVIPVHSNEDLGPGIISKIIRDIELSKEEFEKLLRQFFGTRPPLIPLFTARQEPFLDGK